MKKIIIFLLAIFTFLTPAVSAETFEAEAKHAIAIDANSGKILYEKDAYKSVEVSSISNLITIYLVYEAIEQGKLNLQSKVEISDYPYQLTVHPQATNIPMEAGVYTVEQLLEASLIANASSASIALAEKVAGSEKNFVDMMRAKLKEWKITDAEIVNASGLNNSILGDNIYPSSDKEAENKLSAADVAIIARRLILDYPQVLKISSKTTAKFDGFDIHTHNYMLEGLPSFRSGVDGLRSATSEKAGASFVGTSTQNGMRLITVILNADYADEDVYARFIATSRLMTYISQNFSRVTLVKKGEVYKDSSAPIINGQRSKVAAVASQDVSVIQRNGSRNTIEVTYSLNQSGFDAPIKKGTPVGKLTYKDTELIGQGYIEKKEPAISMVAAQKVERPFFLKAWWNDFVKYVNEKL